MKNKPDFAVAFSLKIKNISKLKNQHIKAKMWLLYLRSFMPCFILLKADVIQGFLFFQAEFTRSCHKFWIDFFQSDQKGTPLKSKQEKYFKDGEAA